jgi:hypothetical protein
MPYRVQSIALIDFCVLFRNFTSVCFPGLDKQSLSSSSFGAISLVSV